MCTNTLIKCLSIDSSVTLTMRTKEISLCLMLCVFPFCWTSNLQHPVWPRLVWSYALVWSPLCYLLVLFGETHAFLCSLALMLALSALTQSKKTAEPWLTWIGPLMLSSREVICTIRGALVTFEKVVQASTQIETRYQPMPLRLSHTVRRLRLPQIP